MGREIDVSDLAGRRGKKRAVLAVAHSILIIAYQKIQRREPYHELGVEPFDKHRPEVPARRLIKRLERLGFQVDFRLPTQSVA